MPGRSQREFLFVVVAFLVFHPGLGRASAQAQNPAAPNGASINRTALPASHARRPNDAWAAPDVDAAAPLVNPSASCSLPNVLAGASRSVQETMESLDRFTAIENVKHQSVTGAGKLARAETMKFDYLVSIHPTSEGYLSVQEFRDRSSVPEEFPQQISTKGVPSLMLVFHPVYAPDFDMKCEGLGDWHGQPAWQVRFEQRRDRESRISQIVRDNKAYGVKLRGRAWILADSYQVARVETDAEPIPAVRLRIEHMSTEYGPVAFSGHTELWLPSSGELYLDLAGRRFYRKHTFTNFTLFSVKVEQRFASTILPAQ